MIKYRIIVSCNQNWKAFDHCFLNISMGQQYHEGEKFISLLAWASQKFKSCHVNIGETIHRHNLITSVKDEDEAYRQAKALGDSWLARNGEAIKQYLTIPYQLKRWDDWINQPGFDELQNLVEKYYEQDPMFKASIEADIRKFVSRIQDKKELVQQLPDYIRSSTRYLLEECAVYILMVRSCRAVRAYPAQELECLKYLGRPQTPENLRGLEHSVHTNLNFKKKKSALRLAA